MPNYKSSGRRFQSERERLRGGSEWNALDPAMNHPLDDETLGEDADQIIKSVQQSYEAIVVRDSSDVEVTTTDTQAAVNLQVALQAAIALVLSISIADSSKADRIAQELTAKIKSSQVNRQQTYIENSRGVRVSTTDTDLAVNAQVLLQILLVLVARLDIL
ncbi:spore coat protein X [Thalassobacillus cyri]|uniref:Spore coat protein X n=2 Tax=Thalassobacillus cyri TaxID=571932 RepID=A0A1H4H3K1_9BACI|nr:spore coat protein X [Thalassobacillus cyri]